MAIHVPNKPLKWTRQNCTDETPNSQVNQYGILFFCPLHVEFIICDVFPIGFVVSNDLAREKCRVEAYLERTSRFGRILCLAPFAQSAVVNPVRHILFLEAYKPQPSESKSAEGCTTIRSRHTGQLR